MKNINNYRLIMGIVRWALLQCNCNNNNNNNNNNNDKYSSYYYW